MRTLEEIKYNYLHFKKYPNEEENKYYKISNESYIKWKTDYGHIGMKCQISSQIH